MGKERNKLQRAIEVLEGKTVNKGTVNALQMLYRNAERETIKETKKETKKETEENMRRSFIKGYIERPVGRR